MTLRKYEFSFSPNVRLRMTFERELALDQEGKIFDHNLYQLYLERHREAVARQNGLMRSFLLFDAISALILAGGTIAIPGTDLNVTEIPAIKQILIIASSFAFLMFTCAFANAQLYEAITQVFSQQRAARHSVDPDFLSAAHTFTEIYLKAFRPKMNIWGVDFFTPSRRYIYFYRLITFLITVCILSVVVIHIAILASGAGSILAHWSGIAISAIALTMNLTALLVGTGISLPFDLAREHENTGG